MDEMELVKAIRHSRDRIHHDYLCSPCAHRDHGSCEQQCDYCAVACQCVCRRWAIPVSGADGR